MVCRRFTHSFLLWLAVQVASQMAYTARILLLPASGIDDKLFPGLAKGQGQVEILKGLEEGQVVVAPGDE